MKPLYRILLIAVLALTTGTLHAQSVGVKLGANLSRMYDSDSDEFVADPKVGYAGGLFATLPFTAKIGLQPELLLSQRGFIGRGSFLGNDYRLSRTLLYLDVPLMLSFRPTQAVSVLLGPQYSYLLSQHDEYTNGSSAFTQTTQFSNENLFKNTLAVIGGLDVALDPVVVGLRAGWDIRKQNGDGTSSDIRYKNMWYQLSVGMTF